MDVLNFIDSEWTFSVSLTQNVVGGGGSGGGGGGGRWIDRLFWYCIIFIISY